MIRRQFILWVAVCALVFPGIIRGAHPGLRARQLQAPAAAGGGGGSIVFIEAVGTDFTATQSPSISYPLADREVNDIWLAVFATETTHTSAAAPAGWFKTNEVDGAGDSVSVFWKRVDGTEDSETWTTMFASTETGRCIILSYRGCITTGTPFDTLATNVGGTGTAHDTTSITTTVVNTMLVSFFTCDPANAGVSTFAWDAGQDITERIDSDTAVVGNNGVLAAIYVAEKPKAAAGAVTMGGDSSQSETMLELIYALKPPP